MQLSFTSSILCAVNNTLESFMMISPNKPKFIAKCLFYYKNHLVGVGVGSGFSGSGNSGQVPDMSGWEKINPNPNPTKSDTQLIGYPSGSGLSFVSFKK